MPQLTKAAFDAAWVDPITGDFPTNSVRYITALLLRNSFEDIKDSVMFIDDNFIDEDSFASDSATKAPSQQSTKAYIAAQIAGISSSGENIVEFQDFTNSPSNNVSLSNFNNGGGAGASPSISTFGVDGTENCAGVLDCSTSTSTAGGSAISETAFQFTFGFGFTYQLSWRCALGALSDGTDTYTVRIGFADAANTTAAIVDGAYFRYTHGTNSGKWEAVTISNSTETVEDTGITADITTFHVFKVVVNDDATQVDFYIDGVKTNDITTNIINSSSRLTGKICTIEKTAGSTARHLYCDYYLLNISRDSAR